jgi:hypothetical protein
MALGKIDMSVASIEKILFTKLDIHSPDLSPWKKGLIKKQREKGIKRP